MEDEADMHKIIIPKGVKDGDTIPVVIGFHGQPKRGKNPRDYEFPGLVQKNVTSMIDNGEIVPIILVLPVFRFKGGNWPAFNPVNFKNKINEIIQQKSNVKNLKTNRWIAFGHSGAAGCRGGGLNMIASINPSNVGFFDTCLGDGWQTAVKTLHKKKIQTLNIFSVETAGFKPRQFPEYQSTFDFGRAFLPLGITPVTCPKIVPGKKLRDLPARCSETKDGIIKGFVVDTGVGINAHKGIVIPALKYFLNEFCGLKIEASEE
jgi:hypothetical protein